MQVAFQPPQPQSEAPQPALAYAPAAPQAQPLDGQTPIAGQAGLAVQPGQQVASLEQAAVPAAADTEEAVMPLPPRRPAWLAVAEAPDVPLPPVRPSALAAIETPLRPAVASAPVLDPAPPALAFAAVEPAETTIVTPAPAPDLRPTSRVEAPDLRAAARPLALRAWRNRTIVAVSAPTEPPPADAAATAQPPAQPGLTGLRRAAHRMSEKAAL